MSESLVFKMSKYDLLSVSASVMFYHQSDSLALPYSLLPVVQLSRSRDHTWRVLSQEGTSYHDSHLPSSTLLPVLFLFSLFSFSLFSSFLTSSLPQLWRLQTLLPITQIMHTVIFSIWPASRCDHVRMWPVSRYREDWLIHTRSGWDIIWSLLIPVFWTIWSLPLRFCFRSLSIRYWPCLLQEASTVIFLTPSESTPACLSFPRQEHGHDFHEDFNFHSSYVPGSGCRPPIVDWCPNTVPSHSLQRFMSIPAPHGVCSLFDCLSVICKSWYGIRFLSMTDSCYFLCCLILGTPVCPVVLHYRAME